MSQSNFVHLHLHSQYSLLDGAITIDGLCKKAKEYQMPAVAITDHGNLFSGVEFYSVAKKAGIKPILGCEVYIQSEGSRFDKKMRRGHEPYHHLVLLAADLEGYRNLCKLISIGYLEGFYYKPRIDKEVLKAHSKGLIVLSGCLSGEMADQALQFGLPGAKKIAEEFQGIFGDRFYLEVQGHTIPKQIQLNEIIFELSKDLSLPVVATNDCHYLHKKDSEAHDALLCIQTAKLVQDEERMRFHGEEFYFKSSQEMSDLFKDHPQSISQSLEIASRCNLELDFKTYYFPKFNPPKEKTLDQHLEEESMRGFEERWKFIWTTIKGEEDLQAIRQRYEERLRNELDMIQKMGFSGYFLIVADFINYAKSQHIPVGPGRGSAAGSLIAYCLKITDIDPIPYNLLFERFLNPERVSMPDMDIDFCMNRRDEVIKYVQSKYGNVGQIITFGKMKAKAVIRDVGRVLNMPYGDVDRIAKLIPNALNITLEEAHQREPILRDLETKDPKVKKLMEIARTLEGLTRHASTHAAGVVISDQPLVNFMPLYKGQNDEIVSQYDMKAVEKIGLIKFDFLGLKTLTVIEDALKIIKRTRGKEIKINELIPDDPEVYQQLSTGDTSGIFQLESQGMRELIIKMKPSVFPDLIALVALYRPGPLGSGMVDEFINRKHGRVEVKYELTQLEPILKETYGVIVYQEQVMQIASSLANFSLGDADILRRAMGKKKADEMDEQRDKFMKGCETNGINIKKAGKIFDLMAKFAEYGFNKSHSAAYAYITYQTAFLKKHFPVEYMASLLTHEMGNTEKVMSYIQDCKEHQIAILPPDINEGFGGFSVINDKEIRFGLAAIKNVGEAAIESIVETRKGLGAFRSFDHFAEEVDMKKVNRRVLESLIKCGAFDSTGIRRSHAFQLLDDALERGSKLQKDKISGQSSLFGVSDAAPLQARGSSLEWTDRERLSFEKEALGFYITGHPLTEFQQELLERSNTDTERIKDMEDGKDVLLGGVVSALREVMTKNGNRMGFVTLEDLKGIVSLVVFPELYQHCQNLLKGETPIFVRGTTDVEEEDMKIIAKEIVSLQQIRQASSTRFPGFPQFPQFPQFQREVHFHLPAERVTAEQLEKFKALLAGHRGDSPAYIHFKGNGQNETILELPEALKLKATDALVRDVDGFFGGPVTILH